MLQETSGYKTEWPQNCTIFLVRLDFTKYRTRKLIKNLGAKSHPFEKIGGKEIYLDTNISVPCSFMGTKYVGKSFAGQP